MGRGSLKEIFYDWWQGQILQYSSGSASVLPNERFHF